MGDGTVSSRPVADEQVFCCVQLYCIKTFAAQSASKYVALRQRDKPIKPHVHRPIQALSARTMQCERISNIRVLTSTDVEVVFRHQLPMVAEKLRSRRQFQQCYRRGFHARLV